MPMMNVRMPDGLLDAFKGHCEASATNQSAVVRALVSNYLSALPEGLQGPVSNESEFDPNHTGGELSSIRINFTVSELEQIDVRRAVYGLTKSGYITQATRSMLLNAPMLSAEQAELVKQSGALLYQVGAAVQSLAVNFPSMASEITPAHIEALEELPKAVSRHTKAVNALLDSVASRNLLQ